MPILCPSLNLIYLPVPKVACTSLKCLFYEINNGAPFIDPVKRPKRFVPDDVHFLNGYATTPFAPGPDDRTTYIAVVRDPLSRFMSGYRNRIFEFRDLVRIPRSKKRVRAAGLPLRPTLDQFLVNFEAYLKASAIIRHHFVPQSTFIGADLARLHHVYPFEDIASLEALMTARLGRPVKAPRLNEAKSTATLNLSMSPAAREMLRRATAPDYRLLSEYYSPPDFDTITFE